MMVNKKFYHQITLDVNSFSFYYFSKYATGERRGTKMEKAKENKYINPETINFCFYHENTLYVFLRLGSHFLHIWLLSARFTSARLI